MKNIIATKIIKQRMRNLLFSLLILSAVFLPYSGSSLGQKSVAKAAGSTSLVISQIQIVGDNGDQKNQFVVLYNPTVAAVTMTNWRLARKDSSGVLANLVASLNGVVAAHNWFLIVDADGYNGDSAKDNQYTDPNNLLRNDNTVLLYSDAGVTLVDKVGYGAAKDFETSPFPTNPGAKSSLVRLPATDPCEGRTVSQDTDNNSRDFARYQGESCNINATGATAASDAAAGDVISSAEDGSWDTDQAIDFPNGKVSDEEQALKDKAQTAMHWWENAFSTASMNCPPAGHSAMREGVVYWGLGSIMKKACWITDIKSLNPFTLAFDVTGHDSSLLDELYATYWPDLAAYKAGGLFVGTQAWIGTALVNGLAGPGGPMNPSPPSIEALGAVYDAGWGIEADRLLTNFEAIQGRNGGVAYVPSVKPLFDNPVDAAIALSMFVPVSKIPFVGVFILKVTKIPEILIMKSVNTSFTYVVKVVNAAVAKTLTNRALSTAGTAARADLETMVVQEIGNRGSRATPAIVFKRMVNMTTKKFVGWKPVATDAIAVETGPFFQRQVLTIGDKEIVTLLHTSGNGDMFLNVVMDNSWRKPLGGGAFMGAIAEFDLTKMFKGTNITLSQQRRIATELASLLGTMFDNDVISQAAGKSLTLLNRIAKGFIIDDSAYARAKFAKDGTGAWYVIADEETHIALAGLEKHNFDIKFLNTYCAHETLHDINYLAMEQYGTTPARELYHTMKRHNPILEGLTEWIALHHGVDKSIDALFDNTLGGYALEVDTVNLMVAKLTQAYMNTNTTIGLTEAWNLMAKNITRAYLRYGQAAFDHIIETPAGKFNSQVLADELAFPNNPLKWGPMSDAYKYIDGLNITKINIIPTTQFAP